MKKIVLLFLILSLACCSSDDSDTNNSEVSTLQVSVTQDATTVGIDEIVTLTATANEIINEISFSKDGGLTFPSSYGSDFGTTANLYLDFESVGTKTVVFRVKNAVGDTVDTIVTIDVERGNAVQVQSLQLNSFFNMGGTWDDEFGSTNPQRLADVVFALLKRRLNVYTGERSNIYSVWYRSEIRANETNLTWDMQNENLLINLNQLMPFIGFGDDDGNNIGQDLMLGPPFERVVPILDYINTQPNSILVNEADIDLEYELLVNW
ncbi:hypothetical protein [Lacinutrix sp. Hel_I_90]|uniref:hypothetical protein n=1 Tax=Lacinutrix sp. Hel_I_90 TaxID=1249999 RepID=UPI0005CAEE09|nr:hypothetical protein [Lacinutrix sp. Hel_I_90]